MTDWDIWRDSHAPSQEPPIGSAPMFYTSGTTGLPKGVRRKPMQPEQQAASERGSAPSPMASSRTMTRSS